MSHIGPAVPKEYITTINMNGLRGRMLRMPATRPGKKREILLIYGHHASIERYYSLAEVLADYGSVTMPDLPGFGGMDSFYKVKEKPDLDTMADYVASFIKMRYGRRRFTLVGMSYGFVVITRMLQRYPDIAKRVDNLVSVVGFAHKNNFTFSRTRYVLYRIGVKFFSTRPTAFAFKWIALNPIVLRTVYAKTNNAKHRFTGLSKQEAKDLIDFEVELWRINDVRTWHATTHSFLTLDNSKIRVDLPVWHIGVKNDNYFSATSIEEYMRKIFSVCHISMSSVTGHSINVMAGKKETQALVPRSVKTVLSRLPKTNK
jgi:pimeloyl-ACP methyl ester carboxylesterase